MSPATVQTSLETTRRTEEWVDRFGPLDTDTTSKSGSVQHCAGETVPSSRFASARMGLEVAEQVPNQPNNSRMCTVTFASDARYACGEQVHDTMFAFFS